MSLWQQMLAQSWNPREWFDAIEDESTYNEFADQEDSLMWVYVNVASDVWEVGFYTPDRIWQIDSTHSTRELAADRVHWLNGGS